MTAYRHGLPDRPKRIARLPLDSRGYPIPWFVYQDGEGEPDLRLADPYKRIKAGRHGLCWVCGEFLGARRTAVVGCVSAISRHTPEPPCHHDCAEYSVQACPFLLNPNAKYRDANLPESAVDPAPGMMQRNSGVFALWTTRDTQMRSIRGGLLFRIGDPEQVRWFTEGRDATRKEVIKGLEEGFAAVRVRWEACMTAADPMWGNYEKAVELAPEEA